MKIFDQLERKRAWEPEEQAILDAVRRVADEVIAPNAAGLRQERRVSLEECRGVERARAQRPLRARGLWRHVLRATQLYLAVREDHLRGLRLHRHHLRHQLPRHEAADRFRQRGAEAAAAAAHRCGRAGLARHHRAECGLRRHRHDDALQAGGRPHRRRRRQDVHHQRQHRRPAAGVRQVERDRRCRAARSRR